MPQQWDLTGQNIENTYQRVLQTPDGINFYDGTGSAVTFTATAGAGGSNTQIQFNSASLLSGSRNFSFDYTTNNIILTGSLLVTQSYISTVDYIDFTLLPLNSLPGHNQGRLHWFDDTKTLQIDTDKNDFMVEIGHQNVVRVYNDTGADIALGKVVRISGSQGNQPSIVTSSWTDDASSAATLGFAATLIAGSGGNKHGYVVTNGILRNVNTLAYPVGTQLYLSSSGNFTNIPPDAPLHEVRLGKVIVSNAITGVIYVDIMNGYELTELHDVKTTTYSDGDLLIHSASLWINSKTLTGSYTLSGSLTTNDGISVQSLTASFVSASSITGSLLGTSSWANSSSVSITSSYALTASYALGTKAPSIVAGGNEGSIQFNAESTFEGSSALTFDSNNNILSLTGSLIATSITSSLLGTASYALFNPYITTIGTRIYTEDIFITAGSKGYKHIGYNANIIKARTIANTNGNIDINVKRNGTTLGTISLLNQSSSLDTTLTGWTTQLNTDDLLEFYVSQSSTYITDISIFIDIQAR